MATVKVCDRCLKGAGTQITLVTGRSRDAGGSMADDLTYRDICGPCAILFAMHITRYSKIGSLEFDDVCKIGIIAEKFFEYKS